MSGILADLIFVSLGIAVLLGSIAYGLVCERL